MPALTLGDPHHLQLVLHNLVENAIKYGGAGGSVWLRSGASGDRVALHVADDGPGIPDHGLARVQQPFQRGLGLQGVRGLGLGLVRAVVAQHGGALYLGRAPEGGLLVTVELPGVHP